MKRSILHLCLVLTSMPGYGACATVERPNQTAASTVSPEQGKTKDMQAEELMKAVEKFVAGQGKTRQEAWQFLTSYPREALIEHLSRAQQTTARDSLKSVEIAFVLCSLDHEYQSNQKIVSSNLKHPANPEVPSDLAAELVIRLIQRGDTDLLPDLFKATAWADGAMGDDLSSFFIEEMKSQPTQFLTELSKQPREIRLRVYGLIFNETTITEEDTRKIKAFLTTQSANSALSKTAQEMLVALSKYQSRAGT